MTVQRSKLLHRRRADEVRTQLELSLAESASRSLPPSSNVEANLQRAQELLDHPRSYRLINDAWRFIHEANQELLHFELPPALAARSIQLRAEITDPKISAWRRQAIGKLLDRFDASLVPVVPLTGAKPQVNYLVEAVKIRDEGASNSYRRLSMQRDYLWFLVLALTFVLIPFALLVATHVADLRTLQPTSCSAETKTEAKPSSTSTEETSEAVPNSASAYSSVEPSTTEEAASAVPTIDPAIQRCRDMLASRPWLFWASLLAGSLGAIASTLQRNFSTKAAERIPEVMAALAATVSRLVLGAIAGLTAYLALRSGIFVIANAQVVAVALLAAFSFGFSERIFTVGETPR